MNQINEGDTTDFKKRILEALIHEIELQVEILEQEFQKELEAASDYKDSFSQFTPKEVLEQKARLLLSEIKTPLAELRLYLTKPIPQKVDDVIKEFTLFDLSFQRGIKTEVLTFFVLPVELGGKIKRKLEVDGRNIFLTSKKDPWYGHKAQDRKRTKSEKIYKEPHPWADIIPTGKFTSSETTYVSKVY